MGIEQATPVLSSIIDLSVNKDLPDLRLPRALKAWTDFRNHHHQQIAMIGTLQPYELVMLANDLSASISLVLHVDTQTSSVSQINKEKVEVLKEAVAGEGNRIIFMRHGEQSPPEWIYSIPNPGIRKIRMMQNPFNRQDLLTNKGLVDVFVKAFGLLYITEATGRKLNVLSSENSRAKEVAQIVAAIIPNVDFSTQEGLSAITYKDENDEPPATIEDLLNELPSGFMPWNYQLVDRWCKPTQNGMKQSELISRTIEDLMQRGTKIDANDLFLVLTHSQQLAEVLRTVDKLQDPSTRFPELTMLVAKSTSSLLIFIKGVLGEEFNGPEAKNMRKTLEILGKDYEWYRIRRLEYKTDQKIPFRVAPQPLYISPSEDKEIARIGIDAVDFMQAADELYKSEEDVKDLLDRGKPEIFQKARQSQYLFVRPDLLITPQGFSICEFETSPFGLALADLLNKAYRSAGFNTLVEDGVLKDFLRKNTPDKDTVIYSQKTSSYAGQLQFLTRELLSGDGREWTVEMTDMFFRKNGSNFYRGFYLYDYLNDLFVNDLIPKLLEDDDQTIPSLTPHMEEKALMALIWDKRWQQFLTHQLGSTALKHLQEVTLRTWILGQEDFFIPGLPLGISLSEDLAGLTGSKRKFVLKKSGFGEGSSWSEGVIFLHKESSEKVRSLLRAASQDNQSLYIIQEFTPAKKLPVFYYDKVDGIIAQMQARVRLTPYFSLIAGDRGRLIAIKATACEKTDYIHASTSSINTAVAA